MGISCKQAVDYISKNEEGKLSVPQRLRLWQHLGVCSLCRTFNRQNKLLGSLFAKRPAGTVDGLTAADKEAIIQALQKADEKR